MTDLTEQWKKGKLKEGAYYVRNEQGVIFTAENYVNYDCFNDTKIYDFYNVETDIKEVLAPVPSYAEYMTMKDCAKMVFEAAERETKLKELLVECREYLNGRMHDSVIKYLLTKIDEVFK